jgi:glycopeptide antibiotics resistance protein
MESQMSSNNRMMKKIFPFALLSIYVVILIKVMVLKDVPLIRVGHLMLNFGGTHDGSPNFIPFKTIWPYLTGFKGWLIAGINLIGNIVLLVPLGFLLPYLIRNMTWKLAFVCAIVCGSVIEIMQVIMHVGIFDIDDIILNALGSMIGFWLFLLFANLMRLPQMRRMTIASLVVVSGAAAIYLFVLSYKGQLPISFGDEDQTIRKQMVNSMMEEKGTKGEDPCRGSGGTGEIVSIVEHAITIKRNDGKQELIRIIDKTDIRSSGGTGSEADLKIGDRVTVVVGLLAEDSQAASLILVCKPKL